MASESQFDVPLVYSVAAETGSEHKHAEDHASGLLDVIDEKDASTGTKGVQDESHGHDAPHDAESIRVSISLEVRDEAEDAPQNGASQQTGQCDDGNAQVAVFSIAQVSETPADRAEHAHAEVHDDDGRAADSTPQPHQPVQDETDAECHEHQ